MRHITLILAAVALAVAAPAIADKGGNPNGGNGNGGNKHDDGGSPPQASESGTLESTAGKGGNGSTGPLEATIALSGAFRETPSGPMVSGDVTFVVTRSKPTDEVFWVTNTCYDTASATVTRDTTATLWGTTESLVGYAGPMPTGGVSCVGYVTLRPWQDRPLKDAVLQYGVE